MTKRDQLFSSSTPFTPKQTPTPVNAGPDQEVEAALLPEVEDVLLLARKTWERYGVVDRTLYRWLDDAVLGFPRPIIINRKMFFRLRELVSWERARVRGRVDPITPRWRGLSAGVSNSNERVAMAHRAKRGRPSLRTRPLTRKDKRKIRGDPGGVETQEA